MKEKPPRHVGLSPEEQGRKKVRRQDEWIWKRRLGTLPTDGAGRVQWFDSQEPERPFHAYAQEAGQKFASKSYPFGRCLGGAG